MTEVEVNEAEVNEAPEVEVRQDAEGPGPDQVVGPDRDEQRQGSDDVIAEGEVVAEDQPVDVPAEAPGDAAPGPDPADGADPAEAAQAAEAAEEAGGVEEVEERLEVSLEDVLATATRERDEFRDHLLRLQADFDNYRKRVHKELGEAGDRALGDFVEGLLPVLDAVDAARVHGAAEVEQVAGLLVDLLARQGLERVGAEGDVFDPTLHDAVLHEAGDDDVQTIAQVLRAGWRWKGKVLRPAMVKVVGG